MRGPRPKDFEGRLICPSDGLDYGLRTHRLGSPGIPGARFVALESRNHLILESEPAWARFQDEIRSFLGT